MEIVNDHLSQTMLSNPCVVFECASNV